MIKTPEEYFQDQEFQVVPDAEKGKFTPAELAFMQKYLGMDQAAALKKLGLEPPAQAAPVAPGTSVASAARPPEGTEQPEGEVRTEAADSRAVRSAPVIEREPDLAEQLKQATELQLVSFFVGSQEFTVPIVTVQEVLRYMPPTRLPTAPSFIAGIINLRGRVTPLVRLRDLLNIPATGENQDKFIVVCRRHGLQIGLMIETVHTMYRATQDSIDWAIESHLGANVNFVSGLMKSGENLIGIISVDHIVDSVLQL
ncbi:chemotaxis protein CheW [Desulfovibrio psychrotolerans]|uniref:Chemotaxis protein CheW n=1 Tax=Desulfovibrio psychrotolerans TaxID=415242 RepID=A0A7J0BV00_9BACT|nr:chemotaxis protein CheW [Desulfovibrio psychrotolerans]GFM37533.1 chemotaxis protein CheW [Desulfovibrio psychrotolerans]